MFVTWLKLFILAQLIELPIYYKLIEAHNVKKLLLGFGASAITHPLLWFMMPWDSAPFLLLLVIGEAAVFIVEGIFLKSFGIKNPFYISTLANSASMITGVLIDYFNLSYFFRN